MMFFKFSKTPIANYVRSVLCLVPHDIFHMACVLYFHMTYTHLTRSPGGPRGPEILMSAFFILCNKLQNILKPCYFHGVGLYISNLI